jgi:cytochrome c
LGPELNGWRAASRSSRGIPVFTRLENLWLPWDQASFAAFMQDPKTKVPGNKMAFAGMKDQAEIASLWAYLARFNADGSSK